MRAVALMLLGGVFLAGAVPAQEALPPGRRIAGLCKVCHGLDGIAKIPIAPNLGGEPVGYLSRQLAAFRSGEREHEMMSVVAKGLTDADIAAVAGFYHAAPVAAVEPAGRDPGKAPEVCSACHGSDGIALIEDAPNLAGESVIYIETQVKAFRSGARKNEIMGPVAQALSDADLRAAAEWYAAVALTPKPAP